MRKIHIKIQNDIFLLSETDLYIFITFLIRCKKEYSYHKIKTSCEEITLFSCKPVFLYVSMQKSINVILQERKYIFTDEEFSEYTEYLYSILNSLHSYEGFDFHQLDPVFMEYMLCVDLPYLYDVKSEEIFLNDLRIYGDENTILHIEDSIYYKMITENHIPEVNTTTNLFRQTHVERLTCLFHSLETDFQPEKSAVVLYQDSNIVRDGSHRIGWLLHTYGNIKIKVFRMFFHHNYYKYSRSPKRAMTSRKNESIIPSAVNSRWVQINGKSSNLMRSDSLSGITSEEQIQLSRYNITTLIDLRNLNNNTVAEQFRHDFKYYNIPFSYILPTDNKPELAAEPCYLYIVSQTKMVKKVLDAILEAKGKIAVFCSIGRDRTGVICAVLQMLCGCSLTEVIEDYSISDLIYENTSLGIEKGFSYEAAQAGMIRFLNAFLKKYKSIEQYIAGIGFSSAEIQMLKNILLP